MTNFVFKIKRNNIKKSRESGIELLRILAIFFVIVIHQITSFLDSSTLFVIIFKIISWPAIFCFAFITGYFLIFSSNSENKSRRFLWITLKIVFWRVLIATLFLIIISFIKNLSVSKFFSNFFHNIFLDLISVKAWYFWAIIFIYLLFPFFVNYLNNNYKIGKKLLKWILFFLIFISINETLNSFLYKYITYKFSLYSDQYTFIIVLIAAVLGGYWHLIEQDKMIKYNNKVQLLGFLGIIFVYLINFSCAWWLNDQNTAFTYWNIFWYLSGWFYFLFFKSFKFKNKIINLWSNLSWWIYIIHNGIYLPRGWAVKIISVVNIDPYSKTICTIFLCYFLSLMLILIIKFLIKFMFKFYILEIFKKFQDKKKKVKIEFN